MTACSTCCAPAPGSEAVSLCVDCGAATVAGVGFSVPALVVLAVAALGIAFAFRSARSLPAFVAGRMARRHLVTE